MVSPWLHIAIHGALRGAILDISVASLLGDLYSPSLLAHAPKQEGVCFARFLYHLVKTTYIPIRFKQSVGT